MKLKTMIKQIQDGFDIGDNTFDYGVYFGYSFNSNDYFDKTLELIASKMDLIKYQPNWYSICDITGFIDKNREVLDEFMSMVYRDEYTPKYICEKEGIEKIDTDTEEFCDIYIDLLFNDIVIGNLTDSDYKILYDLLKNGGKRR